MSNYIQNVANELRVTLQGKNHDYTTTDEFSNFTEAAKLPGLLPFDVMLGQLGIKYSRLLGLNHSGEPEFESFRDSLIDLAGYAVIAAAWLDKERADAETPEAIACPECGRSQSHKLDCSQRYSGVKPHWLVDAGDE